MGGHDRERVTVDLATCSYSQFRGRMGVPVGTSVGKHPAFRDVEQCDPLKPWTVFKKMDDRPLSEQRERYWQQLTDHETQVAESLQEIAARHPGRTLLLLCWEVLDGSNECHRTWAADWLKRRGLTVPELAPPPLTLWD